MNSLYEATIGEPEVSAKETDNTTHQSTVDDTLTPETATSRTDIDTDSTDVNNEQNNSSTNCTIEQKDTKSNGDLTPHKHRTVTKAISHPLEVPSDDEDLFDSEFTSPDPIRPSASAETQAQTQDAKRRVYFPEDERIISGYMDPPRPWNDASSCSTDELIQAYKQSCDRFGIKPLPRLLQQLQVIHDFCDRNETLTLRGERLDYKHCETVEEILRRVQFRTIDLEGTHLEEEGAVALFDMIEYYESCHRLNISNNRTIGIRGWQACARLMKKTPCLENLEMRNCTISEQVMPFMCRSLRLGSMLTTLHLENSLSSGRPLIILVTALKMNDYLRELYLADNKLMPSDGIQLGNLLKYNFRLQLLDVRNNHLQDVGTNHICDGIWEQNLGHGLSTLVLWNNQITFQSMSVLSRALMNTKSLETLNLGHNNLTNEGIHRLKDGLLANKSLLRIGLQAAKISCEGAVAVAEFIAESPRLLRMDLRENDIKTGGLMALSLSLKVSESVTRIDLDKETKRETSMKDYAEQQRRLLNDISNYMQRNRDLARQREEAEEERQQAILEENQRAEEQAAQIQAPGGTTEAGDDDGAEKGDVSKDAGESEEGAEQEEDDIEIAEEVKVHSLRPDSLDLVPGFGAGSKTLDSPAFTMAGFAPEVSFGKDNDTATSPIDQSSKQLSANNEPLPASFPPSPMVSSNGRPTLAPILGASPSLMSTMFDPVPGNDAGPNFLGVMGRQEVFRRSPNSSPTMKRKFIISRVQESKSEPAEDNGQALLKELNVPVVNLDEAFKQASEAETSDTEQSTKSVFDSDAVTEGPSGVSQDVSSTGDCGRGTGTETSPQGVKCGDDHVADNDSRMSWEQSKESTTDKTPVTVSPATDITTGTGTVAGGDVCETISETISDTNCRVGDLDQAADHQTSSAPCGGESHSSLEQGTSPSATAAEAKSVDYSSVNGVRKDMNTVSSPKGVFSDLDLGELELNDVDVQLGNIPDDVNAIPTGPEDFEKELDSMLGNIAEPTAS